MIWHGLVAMIAFILFIMILTSIYLVRISLKPRRVDYEDSYEKEVALGWFTKEYFELLPKIEEFLPSKYGYKIHGFWILNKGARKSVVLSHGYTYTLFGSVKYVDIFRRLGYNVFLYDHRYHGLSGGKTSTYGVKEKEDLKTIVSYVKRLTGEDSIVGTHGESLGGATVLQHASLDKRVDFVISDSSYASLDIQFKNLIKEDYNLPAFPIIYISSFINMLRTGAYYHQVAPVKAARVIKVPTMIIHGTMDSYTTYEQGVVIYEALPCPKRMYSVEGAGHAEALGVDRKKYYLEVKAFLNENDIV